MINYSNKLVAFCASCIFLFVLQKRKRGGINRMRNWRTAGTCFFFHCLHRTIIEGRLDVEKQKHDWFIFWSAAYLLFIACHDHHATKRNGRRSLASIENDLWYDILSLALWMQHKCCVETGVKSKSSLHFQLKLQQAAWIAWVSKKTGGKGGAAHLESCCFRLSGILRLPIKPLLVVTLCFVKWNKDLALPYLYFTLDLLIWSLTKKQSIKYPTICLKPNML